MHKSRFLLGLCPDPAWGAYSAPPDPLAVFKGGGKGGERGEGEEGREGKRWEREEKGGREGRQGSPQIILPRTAPGYL